MSNYRRLVQRRENQLSVGLRIRPSPACESVGVLSPRPVVVDSMLVHGTGLRVIDHDYDGGGHVHDRLGDGSPVFRPKIQ